MENVLHLFHGLLALEMCNARETGLTKLWCLKHFVIIYITVMLMVHLIQRTSEDLNNEQTSCCFCIYILFFLHKQIYFKTRYLFTQAFH